MSHLTGFKKISIAFAALFLLVNTANAQELNKQQKKLLKQIFPGAKLTADYTFKFPSPFDELYITAKDGKKLNALFFKTDSPKGVIFYLHGNNGALNKWSKIADAYTAIHYDIFILDYRGYGKSEGEIESEEQIYSDVQEAYNTVKERYAE